MKVTIVQDNTIGDWMAVYVEGKCVHQHHDIPATRLLEIAGVEGDFVTGYIYDGEGHFPDNLEDVHTVPENHKDQ